MNPLQQPLKVNDEYFSYTDLDNVYPLETEVNILIQYYWNNGEWKIREKSGIEYSVDGDKYTAEQIDIRSDESGYYSEYSTVWEITRDANYNIVSSKSMQTYIP